MGAGMGLMMMSLNTHMLNSAPRELTSRVTSLSQALQNVVSSLAIATFAIILQSRVPAHVTEAARAAGGQPSAQALAGASAAGFGDVYGAALGLVVLAWLLAWTLRRAQQPAAIEVAIGSGRPPRPDAEPEREPVLAGHL
jgi:hypothetical protein